MTLTLHHIGYLVSDGAAAQQELCDALGYECISAPIKDSMQQAVVQFFRQVGNSVLIETIVPSTEASHLHAALNKGMGLHHMCYETPDIDAAIGQLREKGFLLLREPVPAVAFGGRRIAWLMNAQNLLVEVLSTQ